MRRSFRCEGISWSPEHRHVYFSSSLQSITSNSHVAFTAILDSADLPDSGGTKGHKYAGPVCCPSMGANRVALSEGPPVGAPMPPMPDPPVWWLKSVQICTPQICTQWRRHTGKGSTVETRCRADWRAVARLPLPGTIITRPYKGETLQVRVLPKGFEYQGDVYKSLSAVAKAITGTHCNGYLFFRLGKEGETR